MVSQQSSWDGMTTWISESIGSYILIVIALAVGAAIIQAVRLAGKARSDIRERRESPKRILFGLLSTYAKWAFALAFVVGLVVAAGGVD